MFTSHSFSEQFLLLSPYVFYNFISISSFSLLFIHYSFTGCIVLLLSFLLTWYNTLCSSFSCIHLFLDLFFSFTVLLLVLVYYSFLYLFGVVLLCSLYTLLYIPIFLLLLNTILIKNKQKKNQTLDHHWPSNFNQNQRQYEI